MPSLAIIGDSHANIYERMLPCTVINGLQLDTKVFHTDSFATQKYDQVVPHLMHTIGMQGDTILRPYTNADYVLLVYGEPDIRMHVHGQILKGRTESDVLTTLAENYIKQAARIDSCKHVFIRYILPPRRVSSFCNGLFVPQGSFEDRVRYTNRLNAALETACVTHGAGKVHYIPNRLKEVLTDETGELKDIFTHEQTHYTPAIADVIVHEFVAGAASML
jgi:hypothetical protein